MYNFTKDLLPLIQYRLAPANRLIVKLIESGGEATFPQLQDLAEDIAALDNQGPYEPRSLCNALGIKDEQHIRATLSSIEFAHNKRVDEEVSKLKGRKASKKRQNLPTEGTLKLNRNDEGKAFVTVDNVELILAYLGVTVRVNLFANSPEIQGLEKLGFDTMSETCISWLEFRVQEGDIRLTLKRKEDLLAAVKQIAYANRYHPIKDYLESVKWDGTPRLDTWLIENAGVEDNEYSRAVSALPLMAAVKRVYEPGSKFDEMLVLCSGQGWDKSSAMAALMPNKRWFSDDLPLGADAKVTMERTVGVWFIEAADLQNFNKVDHNKMKAFMSRRSDRARLAFERLPSEIDRQWIIIGTVNDTEFLSDPTGDRRYWPLSLGHAFNIENVKATRDQLWAEAYHRTVTLRQSIRLDKSLWQMAADKRESFTVSNPYKEALAPVLYNQSGQITNASLFDICGVPIAQRKGTNKLKQAMEQLGWVKMEPVWSDGTTVRCWSKGSQSRWLVPVQNNQGQWEFTVNRQMSESQKLREFDEATSGQCNLKVVK